jgi:creatinine amidohydrolase
MRYEMMFPDQIRKAIRENWPVILPAGVLEYHSEHCVTGVDTLLVIKAVEELEKEMPMVILPAFYYGAGSYVVEKPENNGTVHVDASAIQPFAKELLFSLLRIGFRNIHIFIHHQTENFASGMPTDLAFRLASRQVTFEFLEKERGENWWGDNSSEDYYSEHEGEANPFNWIQVHPLMNEVCQQEFPIDHAGKQESSLMMAFCPDGIDMGRFSGEKWYAREATNATLEYGLKAKATILDGMREVLK